MSKRGRDRNAQSIPLTHTDEDAVSEVRAQLIERITSATLTDDGQHLVMHAQHNGNGVALAFHTREILSFLAALTKAMTGSEQERSGSAVPPSAPPKPPVPSGLAWIDDAEKFDISTFQSVASG